MPRVAVHYDQLFGSVMSTAACLGCNSATDARDRRLPLGPNSKLALSAWKDIIALKVEADRSLETVAAYVQTRVNSGFWCRKCFTLFERYEKTKVLLLANIQSVLSSQPGQHELVGSKRSSAEIDDDSTNHVKVARLTQAHARRHLSFSAAPSSSSSPPVVVSLLLNYFFILLLYVNLRCYGLTCHTPCMDNIYLLRCNIGL